MSMKLYTFIVGTFLVLETFAIFTAEEFQAIESISQFLNFGLIVFIEDESNSKLEILDVIKMSSERNLASTVLTTKQLKQILSCDSRLFHRRTMLVTKSKINLGSLLELIQRPKLVLWTLFMEPSDIMTVGQKIPYQGRILQIKPEMNRLVIYELLQSHDDGGIVEWDFGYINSGSKAVFSPQQLGTEYINKLNMSNFVVKVAISSEICRSRKDGVLLEVVFCSHSKILELMVEKLNIRRDYIRYPETQYSFVYPNGSYSGYFKMVLDREVNMSVAGFVVTRKRLDDFDFIWPTFSLDTVMYLRKSDIVEASFSSSPFSYDIWIVILMLIALTASFLIISDYTYMKLVVTRGNNKEIITTSFLKIYQLVCGQGSSDDPPSSSSKMLHCTSLFVGMLLYYYYSAVVLSYLTVESLHLPFTDLEGFIKNEKYKIIAPAGGFVSYFVEFELTQFRQKAGKYLVPSDKLPISIEDCVTELCDKKSLTLLEVEGSVLNIEGANCELTKIPSPIFTQFFGFALVKGFPFTEYFQLVLWRLGETGLLNRMKQNLTLYDDVKDLHKDADYNTVAIEQIINVLIILNFGFIISICIFFIEFLHYNNYRKMWSLKRPTQKYIPRDRMLYFPHRTITDSKFMTFNDKKSRKLNSLV